MTNIQIAELFASLQAQITQIAGAVVPPPPVVQSAAARAWLPNINVILDPVLKTSTVVDIFNNRDDAFAARADLAAQDPSSVYRVMPECRDDSGVACSVVVVRARAREAVAA